MPVCCSVLGNLLVKLVQKVDLKEAVKAYYGNERRWADRYAVADLYWFGNS